MGTLTVYEISEEELRLIAAGDTSSTYLNFGLVCVSLGGGVGATLATAGPVQSRPIFDILVIVTVLGLLVGAVFLAVWRRQAKTTKSVIQTVRERARTEISAESITVAETR